MKKKVLAGREKVRVAAVQAAPIFMDKGKTIEKACRLIKEAGSNGAELIAFSEAFIPTYPAFYTGGFESDSSEWRDYIRQQQKPYAFVLSCFCCLQRNF